MSTATLSFLLHFERCGMKNVQPLLLLFAGDSCSLPLCMPVWKNFSWRWRTFHCTFDFQNLCTMKERSLWFVFKQKHVVEEAKILIKLIAANSNHFTRYKCKITHCLDSQTFSEYISRIVFDGNENFSISGVQEVLTGVGTFTSTNK